MAYEPGCLSSFLSPDLKEPAPCFVPAPVVTQKTPAIEKAEPEEEVEKAEDEDDLWGAKRRIRDRELTKDNAPENKPKVIKTWKQESVARKKRDKLHKEDPRLERTVFIGNVAVGTSTKELTKFIKESGCDDVESIRFRSVAFDNLNLTKKVSFILQKNSATRDSMNAYVVLKSPESLESVLALNGRQFKEKSLRVDRAAGTQEHNHSASVFLGGLPYTSNEEEIRLFFKDCGEVENVRLIRDSLTGIGKGIGFVLFKDGDGVELALKLNNSQFKGRKIRVSRSTAQPNSKKRKAGENTRPGNSKKGKTFQGEQAPAKGQKSMKNTKKRGRKKKWEGPHRGRDEHGKKLRHVPRPGQPQPKTGKKSKFPRDANGKKLRFRGKPRPDNPDGSSSRKPNNSKKQKKRLQQSKKQEKSKKQENKKQKSKKKN